MTEYDRWKNRRRMAWICMIAAIGYPLLVLASDSKSLGDIAVPFYMFVSAVVGAYIGFATWEDTSKSNRPDTRYNRRYDNDPSIEPQDDRPHRWD